MAQRTFQIIVWTTIVWTANLSDMATPPRNARARRFDSPEQEAYLALWRTYDRLRALEDELFAGFDLTAQQYNLLRLLRAAHEPIPTLAVAERLVSRAPDITRMLDRLEKDGFISRVRSTSDRRTVLVSSTAREGIAGPHRGTAARLPSAAARASRRESS